MRCFLNFRLRAVEMLRAPRCLNRSLVIAHVQYPDRRVGLGLKKLFEIQWFTDQALTRHRSALFSIADMSRAACE